MTTPFPTPIFEPIKTHNLIELLEEINLKKIFNLDDDDIYKDGYNIIKSLKEIKTPSPSPIETNSFKFKT